MQNPFIFCTSKYQAAWIRKIIRIIFNHFSCYNAMFNIFPAYISFLHSL